MQMNLFYFIIIVNSEHVFTSWARDKVHKITQMHIKQYMV